MSARRFAAFAVLQVGWVVCCVHTGPTRKEYVLCEKAGGVVSRILTGANRGTPVDAITLGSRTLYFRNVDDECLRVHEAQHRLQEAVLGARFYGAYLDELAKKGYEGNLFEKEAMRAQLECEAGRTP
jgi:hypothetical protein